MFWRHHPSKTIDAPESTKKRKYHRDGTIQSLCCSTAQTIDVWSISIMCASTCGIFFLKLCLTTVSLNFRNAQSSSWPYLSRPMGKCIGISFIDSTPLRVCKNQRILQNKSFKGIAQRGKFSMGWFSTIKLQIICNEMGEIVNFIFKSGSPNDRDQLKVERLQRNSTEKSSPTEDTSVKTSSANSLSLAFSW